MFSFISIMMLHFFFTLPLGESLYNPNLWSNRVIGLHLGLTSFQTISRCAPHPDLLNGYQISPMQFFATFDSEEVKLNGTIQVRIPQN